MAHAHEPSSARLRVLDATVVTPSGAPAQLPPSTIPLTNLYLMWLHSPPVERLFFYRLSPVDDDQRRPDDDHLLSCLKSSLSTALRAFFPLAGHVRVITSGLGGSGGGGTRHGIVYEPGDGVAFTVAEYEADVGDLASDDPRPVAELAQLVSRLAGSAVLAVQATVLRGGLALGVTVHHAACDGSGSTSFLHTWAAACAGAEELLPSPVIDRTLIGDLQRLYDHYLSSLPSTEEIDQLVKTSPDNLVATFTLSMEHLQCVKDAVAGEATRHGQTPPRCTTLVAALGFIWSCHCRAEAAETGTWSGNGADDPTYFLLAVDHRQRMNPPVPATYLGNCVGPAIGAAPKKDVAAAAGAGGPLLTACAAIAAGIEKATATPEWETMVDRIKEVRARSVLGLAGSPRFRVYDVNFGFGRPVKVEILSVELAVAESGRSSSGGKKAIEVGVALPPTAMEAFRRCFADAIACLLTPPHRHAH